MTKSLISGLISLGLLFGVGKANGTDIELFSTYLPPEYIPPDSLVSPSEVIPKIRGPQGTKIYAELTNGVDTLRHARTFNENGYAKISDAFNPEVGIEDNNVPVNNNATRSELNSITMPQTKAEAAS